MNVVTALEQEHEEASRNDTKAKFEKDQQSAGYEKRSGEQPETTGNKRQKVSPQDVNKILDGNGIENEREMVVGSTRDRSKP